MKLSQLIFSFLMGYFSYSLIEILLRGYTHWTMCLTGGAVLTLLCAVNSRPAMTLIRSCLAGSLLITAIEFTVGFFDNIIMHWNVWDYSDMPLKFLGQVCIPFSCFWFILCIPARGLCLAMNRRFAGNVYKKAVPIASEQPL